MTALTKIPRREALRAVMLKRTGTGWRVGIGSIVTGELDGDGAGYGNERQAEAAAVALADECDLIAVQD